MCVWRAVLDVDVSFCVPWGRIWLWHACMCTQDTLTVLDMYRYKIWHTYWCKCLSSLKPVLSALIQLSWLKKNNKALSQERIDQIDHKLIFFQISIHCWSKNWWISCTCCFVVAVLEPRSSFCYSLIQFTVRCEELLILSDLKLLKRSQEFLAQLVLLPRRTEKINEQCKWRTALLLRPTRLGLRLSSVSPCNTLQTTIKLWWVWGLKKSER